MSKPMFGIAATLSPLIVGVALAQPAPSVNSSPSGSASASPPSSSGAPAAEPQPPAQSPEHADDARKAEAQVHFQNGLALFKESVWDAALAEFQRSIELYPTRPALENAALCLRKLHRFNESLEALETVVREYRDMPPEERAVADRTIAELSALVGTLEIRGAEPGSVIVIDGRERGTFPSGPLQVSAGTHLVRVYKQGFLPFERSIEVGGRQTASLEAQLGALMRAGRLSVTEQGGKEFDVVVDNLVVGKTPWEGSVAEGQHAVLLRGPGTLGTQPASAPVRVNQLTTLTLAAEPLEATLRIEPQPAGASVAIDGVTVGRGVWQGRVRVGGHQVEIAAEGFLPVTRQVTATADKQEIVSATLERDPTSPLWKAANPPRFHVAVEGAWAWSPSLGGQLVSGCSGSCDKSAPMGFNGMALDGYQLSSGLGFGFELGYLTVEQTLAGRDTIVTPEGQLAYPGTANDTLRLQGVLAGAHAGFQSVGDLPITLRLGAGALLGSVRDQRTGTFTTSGAAPLTYAVDVTDTAPARYLYTTRGQNLRQEPLGGLGKPEGRPAPGNRKACPCEVYLDPEARLGWRLSKHFELSAEVRAVVLLALKQPQWEQPVVGPASVGLASFGQESLSSKTIVVLAPGLGATYSL